MNFPATFLFKLPFFLLLVRLFAYVGNCIYKSFRFSLFLFHLFSLADGNKFKLSFHLVNNNYCFWESSFLSTERQFPLLLSSPQNKKTFLSEWGFEFCDPRVNVGYVISSLFVTITLSVLCKKRKK